MTLYVKGGTLNGYSPLLPYLFWRHQMICESWYAQENLISKFQLICSLICQGMPHYMYKLSLHRLQCCIFSWIREKLKNSAILLLSNCPGNSAFAVFLFFMGVSIKHYSSRVWQVWFVLVVKMIGEWVTYRIRLNPRPVFFVFVFVLLLLLLLLLLLFFFFFFL